MEVGKDVRTEEELANLEVMGRVGIVYAHICQQLALGKNA